MHPDLELFKLGDGREVRIEAVHLERSMAGFLEGPLDRMWAELIGSAPNRMIEAWGDRKVHLIEPLTMARVITPPPTWCVHVWLTSKHTSVAGAHGSALVVVFFCSHISSWPLADLIAEEVREIDWDALAKAFWY